MWNTCKHTQIKIWKICKNQKKYEKYIKIWKMLKNRGQTLKHVEQINVKKSVKIWKLHIVTLFYMFFAFLEPIYYVFYMFLHS
jgi:hypothetical protein